MRDLELRCAGLPTFLSATALAAGALLGQPALAQLPTQLLGGMHAPGGDGRGGLGGALGGFSGGSLPSVAGAGAGNTAGVLGYCVKNNYLGGAAAGAVQRGLIGKLGGPAQAQRDSGFTAGSSGMLQSGGGTPYTLGGTGGGVADSLKRQATQKVCDLVLQHAKS